MANEEGRTGRVHLTLPRRLAPEDIARLTQELQDVSAAELVTLGGSAGVFCEGATLPLQPEALAEGSSSFATLLRLVQGVPCPLVALVDGPALGGGLGLAAAADIVLASPDARFGLPEALVGIIPALVLPIVAARIGAPRARLLAFGAVPLAAKQAQDWGLVDEVDENLEAALERHARRLARMDRRAIAAVKRLVSAHFGAPDAYLADATARQIELLRSEPTAQRLTRFLAGEAPWTEEETS